MPEFTGSYGKKGSSGGPSFTGKAKSKKTSFKGEKPVAMPGGRVRGRKGSGPGLLTKTVSNLVETAVGTPAGLWAASTAIARDYNDTRQGKPTLKRTAGIGEAMVKSTVETVKHPLRRPGDTLLLGLGAYGTAAGLTSRGAAAGSAARAARLAGKSGTRAALTRAGHEGGSLLRKPAPGPRIRKVGDMEVRSRYSTSAGIRSVQKGVDKLEGKLASGEGRVAGVANARSIRKTGKELGLNRVVEDAAKRAPAKRLARMGLRLNAPQQMAVRLWGQRLTVDEKIAQHRRSIAELADAELPKAVKQQRAKNLMERIALAEAARPYMDGTEIARTFPKVRGAASPAQMSAFIRQADRVAGKKPGGRERVLLDAGLLEPDQITFRTNAPGRIGLGAKWGSSAERAVKQLDEIEGKRRDLTPEPKVVPGEVTKTVRKRTRVEAEKRIADIDEALAPLISEWAANLKALNPTAYWKSSGKGVPLYRDRNLARRQTGDFGIDMDLVPNTVEWMKRDVDPTRGAKVASKRTPEGDAFEMLSQIAGREKQYDVANLETLLEVRDDLANRGIDVEGKLRKVLDERADLERRLIEDPALDPEAVFGGQVAKEGDFGEVAQTTRAPDQIVPGELDDAAKAALAELDRQESKAFHDLANDRDVLVGFEEHQGRLRIPDVPMRRQKTAVVGRGTPYRGGIPNTPRSLRDGYTGALEESGDYRINAAHELAASALEAGKYTSILDLRQKILKAGVKARPADSKLVQWVPVREQRLTAKQRRMLGKAQPLPASESQWGRFLEDVFPREEFGKVAVGQEVPNVVWVPRQLFANMNKPFESGPGAGAIAGLDTVLNLVKFGIIPLKPAYITANAIGNVTFNLVQQGVLLPRNWKQAVTLLRDQRTAAAVREVMGSGGMSALVSGNPRGLGVLNRVTHGYGNLAAEVMLEPMMRVSALVHEARRMGFKSNAQIYRLLTDQKKADDLAEITRRAKQAIVDYDRMGPLEKGIARRALFIYPWVKGSTLYTGSFLMEHPIQAGVASQLTAVGRENRENELGPVPSYARGSFKVGGTPDFPLTVNPSSISPVSQTGELGAVALDALFGGGGSSDRLVGLLHPALESGFEAATNRDQFTGAPLEGSAVEILLRRLVDSMAPKVAYDNYRRAQQPRGERLYPMSEQEALLRFLLGSFMPRTTNRKTLNERAAREQEHPARER